MAHLREEVLNSYLGLLLDHYDGISATTEMRTPRHAIDITVTHSSVPDPVPILIEAKNRRLSEPPAECCQTSSLTPVGRIPFTRIRTMLPPSPEGCVRLGASDAGSACKGNYCLCPRAAHRLETNVARRNCRRPREQP